MLVVVDSSEGRPADVSDAGRHGRRLPVDGNSVALLGAVDGGTAHPEQISQLRGAVLSAALQQGDQVRFQPRVELGPGFELSRA